MKLREFSELSEGYRTFSLVCLDLYLILLLNLNVLPGQEKELQFLFSALKDPHKLAVFLLFLLLFLNFPVWSSESTSDFLTFPNRHSLRRSCWPPSQLWLQGLQSDQCDQPGNKIKLFFKVFTDRSTEVNFFQVCKNFISRLLLLATPTLLMFTDKRQIN